jgi:hypothetical protein
MEDIIDNINEEWIKNWGEIISSFENKNLVLMEIKSEERNKKSRIIADLVLAKDWTC